MCHLRLATLCSMDATACSALSAAADPACGVATAPPWGMAFRERLTAAPRRLAAGLALCGMPAEQCASHFEVASVKDDILNFQDA